MTGVSHQTGTDTVVKFAIGDAGVSVVTANHYALRAWVHLGAGRTPCGADLFGHRGMPC